MPRAIHKETLQIMTKVKCILLNIYIFFALTYFFDKKKVLQIDELKVFKIKISSGRKLRADLWNMSTDTVYCN